MLDDPISLLTREVLRERTAELIAEACAWSVGMSDQPYLVRRAGRLVDSGQTLGMRAEAGHQLSGDEDGRLELADGRPGSFRDALNALAPGGGLHAERLEEQVIVPSVFETCTRAAERARRTYRAAWFELLDDLGEDEDDLPSIVRTAEWEAPLRTVAEQLVLAALSDVPLVEVEAEGLPLSLVRAAEEVARGAAVAQAPEHAEPAVELAGAQFLAEVAITDAGLPVPVPPAHAADLLSALLAQGLETDEVLAVLPGLPVQPDTAERVAALTEREE